MSLLKIKFLQIYGHEDDVNAVAFADESSQILFSGGDDGLCKVKIYIITSIVVIGLLLLLKLLLLSLLLLLVVVVVIIIFYQYHHRHYYYY